VEFVNKILDRNRPLEFKLSYEAQIDGIDYH
jgi:hypothetical protein